MYIRYVISAFCNWIKSWRNFFLKLAERFGGSRKEFTIKRKELSEAMRNCTHVGCMGGGKKDLAITKKVI